MVALSHATARDMSRCSKDFDFTRLAKQSSAEEVVDPVEANERELFNLQLGLIANLDRR